MDVFTKKKRSEIMSKIRSKNTKIENVIFRELHRQGIYFQKHYRKVAGRPDVAMPRKKIAIFIDGDFWHGYRFLKIKKRLPRKYWRRKIESNIERDKKNRSILKEQGWKILRIWEHDIVKNKEKILKKIINFLK
jgi:DNA mismatch endonuclease (patch repair protein)